MFTALFIACLFVLCYYAVEDLHDSVVIALRYDPDAKINKVSMLAYKLIERRRK